MGLQKAMVWGCKACQRTDSPQATSQAHFPCPPKPPPAPGSPLTWGRPGRGSSSGALGRGWELWGEHGAIRGGLILAGSCPRPPSSPVAAEPQLAPAIGQPRAGGDGADGPGGEGRGSPGAFLPHPHGVLGREGEMSRAGSGAGGGDTACGDCLGLTWKRAASLSGELSPLVWLGEGSGSLGRGGAE